MDKNKCLIDGCDEIQNTRGMCNLDYQLACRIIKEKKTTWEELEEKGMAKPLKRSQTFRIQITNLMQDND